MFRFLTGVAAAVLMLAATPDQAQSGSAKRSGTVHIEQVQIALLISANLGGGTLTYKGKTHKFSIGGIGVGGTKEEGGRVSPFFEGFQPQFFFSTADITGMIHFLAEDGNRRRGSVRSTEFNDVSKLPEDQRGQYYHYHV